MIIENTTDPQVVARYITDQITRELQKGRKVLWFIPGGSSIPAAALAAHLVVQSGISYEGLLTVTLTDERFGPVGHRDSNWQQLLTSGFSLPSAHLVSVLTSATDAVSREIAAKIWAQSLSEKISWADYILGFFGIGADGHIAGMLPHTSPLDSSELADSYKAEKYERITIAPVAMQKMSENVAFAVGESKWPALRKLVNEHVPVADQPAQLLKGASRCTLFTDLIE